jgi:hypothetical protein
MNGLFMSITTTQRYFLLSLIIIFISACSPGSEELEAAQAAEATGDLIKAVDLYTTVVDTYPESQNAQQADQALQRIYTNYAESLEKDHPIRAINIYEVIINRWPETSSADHASIQYELLKAREAKKQEEIAKDQQACEAAKQTSTKEVWTAYLDKYPEGECESVAKQFLTRRPMNQEELSTVQTFLSQCEIHIKQCKSYKSRYDGVIRKGRLDYVNRVLVPYAKREHDKAQAIIDRAAAYLDGLVGNNIDIQDQLDIVTESCTVCEDIVKVEEE